MRQKVDLPCAASCLHVEPDEGKFLLVGLGDGAVLLVATGHAALGKTTLRTRLNSLCKRFTRSNDAPEHGVALHLSSTGPTTGTIRPQPQQQ